MKIQICLEIKIKFEDVYKKNKIQVYLTLSYRISQRKNFGLHV